MPFPNFLSNLVALASFMRLSLRKGAQVALSSAAWQKIRALRYPRNSRVFGKVAFGLSVFAVLCCVVAGQQKAKLPGEDWIQLFNGVDLGGWTKIGRESWTVEDGVLHGKG